MYVHMYIYVFRDGVKKVFHNHLLRGGWGSVPTPKFVKFIMSICKRGAGYPPYSVNHNSVKKMAENHFFGGKNPQSGWRVYPFTDRFRKYVFETILYTVHIDMYGKILSTIRCVATEAGKEKTK